MAGCQSGCDLCSSSIKLPGEAIFGERGFELVFVFQFLALLRRHVSLEKNFAWIFGLCAEKRRREKKKAPGEQDRTDFLHHGSDREDSKAGGSCNGGVLHILGQSARRAISPRVVANVSQKSTV